MAMAISMMEEENEVDVVKTTGQDTENELDETDSKSQRFPATVFISYSHRNATTAGDLKNELESNYYPCFLAHDDIQAGADWHEEIWKTLRKSRAFVGLVTDNFISSAFWRLPRL